jgi:hypothetical protein
MTRSEVWLEEEFPEGSSILALDGGDDLDEDDWDDEDWDEDEDEDEDWDEDEDEDEDWDEWEEDDDTEARRTRPSWS